MCAYGELGEALIAAGVFLAALVAWFSLAELVYKWIDWRRKRNREW